ncbi:MAG: redoxin family protein [Ruminococcus sp.]|jgi:cytochrome c-type biogenesis protein|nr:redoxin family protein [Ruminococcus sp.]
MNLAIETGVPAAAVFIQGVISFFSPCVLPLIPLYITYLSGGAKEIDGDGNTSYKQSKVIFNTLFFVIGISFAFFLLGLGFTAIGRFFHNYQTWFTRVGGIIIILFGLTQLDVFGKSSARIGKEHRFHFQPDSLAMNPLTALILGFTFSFAWTPCVGPALASVLIMAASSASHTTGFLLIGVYTLGFILPFMGVGIFTGALLDFFKKHRNVVKYTVKVGGILMILIGIMMFTGWMNGFSSYLSGLGDAAPKSSSSVPSEDKASVDENKSGDINTKSKEDNVNKEVVAAPDFTLTDQYGNTQTLSDYKGKTVFLNFWATWCPPCRAEMPEIQTLYEEYGENADDVIILGIASPNVGREGSAEDVTDFLEEKGYNYPVAMDIGGEIATVYGVSALPTTFMIDKDGNVFGYVSGQLTKDIMVSIIEQAVSGIRQ